jgi:FHS family L-fucose permease-like MFS transporter
VAFALGRWLGCWLMRWIAPERLLTGFALGGAVAALLPLFGWTLVSGIAVLSVQIFAAIVWPTILGLAIRDKGPLMQLATALICMGSAAGGTLSQQLIMIFPAEVNQSGMLVPALAFLGIFAFTRLLAHRPAGARPSASAAIPSR